MTKKELKKKLLEPENNIWTWDKKSLRAIDKINNSPFFPFCGAVLAAYHHRAGFMIPAPVSFGGLFISGSVFTCPKEACLSFNSRQLFCHGILDYDLYITKTIPVGLRVIGQQLIDRVLSEVASEEGLTYSVRRDHITAYYYIRLEGKDCVWKALELPYKIRDKINTLGPSLSKKTPLYI